MFKVGIFRKDYEYVTIIDKNGARKGYVEKCHWMSKDTGEVLPDLCSVIKTATKDLFKYHIINVRWKYSENGEF